METADRLYIPNKDRWLNDCNKNYRVEYMPKICEYEKAIILPARFLNGTVGHHAGGVCDENFNFLGGLIREYGKMIPRWGGVGESYTVKKEELAYMDETVVFGGVLIARFGHMLLDNMSRLWWHVLNKNSTYKICFIVTADKPKKWMYDFFDLLEIDRSRIMIVEKPTQFSKVIVPEEAAHSWDNYTDMWELPYNLLAENALKKVNVKELPKKIYLTKRFYTEGAKTINEEYFENFYKSHGYEVIAPEQLPVYQQIALAANAEAIATTLGSTSHFNVLSRRGTRIDILLRVEDQTVPAQCLINQMRQADYYFVDVSVNYLPYNRTFGVVYLDKTEEWHKFVENLFGEKQGEIGLNPAACHSYLTEWTDFYLNNPDRFNAMRLGDWGAYDFLKRMCKVLLNKEPDQRKYNLTNSPQQLKVTVNQLQKEAENNKRQTSDLQNQLNTKAQRVAQLEKENVRLTQLNAEFSENIKTYKSVYEDNADLQSSNTQLDNRLKEEKVRYAELLNKHFKLAEDLTLCQTQIGEINGNIASLYTKLDAKDSDIKSLQGENKTLLQENRSLQKKNGEYAATILKNQSEIADYNSRIIHLEKSLSFRLGRAITFIPRKIRDLFRKKK